MGVQVKKSDDSVGPEVDSAVKDLQNGEVSAVGRGRAAGLLRPAALRIDNSGHRMGT